ncbi:Na/Pi cotransporter family protein [Candidatus Sulfurimonas marisnigri]|uniref:Na/Pi cotransporter family protein n=1 Tax=Candidatus Sulfurimonas marisnigri TaxID=2740405 RepID=A0A7S7RPR5_9BACT|nr:Na/Pi cotransporter family protein [Candidatus Sulfurimonas marisnigri]QOY53834.1 Na/Pi cotransporter family protein [Candidatus Sulfurimonas marisnigri]
MGTDIFKRSMYPLFLLAIAYLLFSSADAKTIIAGIAIFLIGMVFMEDGFKLFSGGMLEKVLEKSTKTVPKAIGTGFLATAIVQSSSLLTIIIISFLSAELISLSGAIGVIFGSNIGTTTTAWIVSAFGVKINIAHYAMPMLIFGVVFRFNQNKSYQGLGNILVGLGFVFLGIGYMKEGFEGMKAGLDLAQFAMDGYLGVLVYILIGAVATVVIQSSSATMAIIITALATGQIEYVNALALAIGANIGTTVTAIIGSLSSNANGKRLAVAHFIFNIVTGFIAIVFLYQLADFVDVLSASVGIGDKDYAMKLALFHTVFNIIGVLAVSPFTHKLVVFLEGLFLEKNKNISRAKYLDSAVIEVPESALAALDKELLHLYDNATEVLSHAISLHRHSFLGKENVSEVVKQSSSKIDIDVNRFYETKIKELYGDIVKYATLSQDKMDEFQIRMVYYYKVASKDIVEAIKEVEELQKNINFYQKSKNDVIKNEYNVLREKIANTLNSIHEIRNGEDDDMEILLKIKLLKEDVKDLDIIANGRIDTIIRNNSITSKMATSLINDSSFAYDISKRLIEVAITLFIKDKEIKTLAGEIT